MKKKEQPAYQVYAEGDFVFTKVNGRASYLNCAPLKEFLHGRVVGGCRRLAFDFEGCASMDSTFLGTLVGIALELRKADPPGSVALLRLSERNLDVVRNLGIHRLVSVEADDSTMDFGGAAKVIEVNGDRAQVDEELICEAHKRLAELNEKNARLFQDVVGFLEQCQEEEA